MDVGPFDPPTRKPYRRTIKVNCMTRSRNMVFEIFQDGGGPPFWICSNWKQCDSIRLLRKGKPYPRTEHARHYSQEDLCITWKEMNPIKPLLRSYGHSKIRLPTWLTAANLDLVQLNVASLILQPRKTYRRTKYELDRIIRFRDMAVRNDQNWRPSAILNLIKPE